MEIYLVGGAVRDELLQIPVREKDWVVIGSSPEEMIEKGYQPVVQSWADGSWGCGSFLVALLLCFVVIGLVVFVYMLIVKPAGTLTVTYRLKS